MKPKSALQPPHILFPKPPLRRQTSLTADARQLFGCAASANKPGGLSQPSLQVSHNANRNRSSHTPGTLKTRWLFRLPTALPCPRFNPTLPDELAGRNVKFSCHTRRKKISRMVHLPHSRCGETLHRQSFRNGGAQSALPVCSRLFTATNRSQSEAEKFGVLEQTPQNPEQSLRTKQSRVSVAL